MSVAEAQFHEPDAQPVRDAAVGGTAPVSQSASAQQLPTDNLAGSPELRGLLRLFFWLAVLGVLVALVPRLAERVAYSIARGRLLAEAEIARQQLANLPRGEERYRLVAKSVFPGVVGVEAERPGEIGRIEGGALWPLEPKEESFGSGVIVDSQGFIVTSLHVIAHAKAITVRLADGRTFKEASVVGGDPLNDLAVLKIPASGLVAVPWGDSNQLEVGDAVLAIGNPYGLSRSVTAGIVSAKERRARSNIGGFQEFLQTDAAMNPGNSGGPLVNLRGEIVGINSAIYGDAYRGISFAIPSRVARDVYEQICREGQSRHGWLGIQMADLDDAEAERRGLESPRGALVLSVLPSSPAELAGIRPGDVILTWNGKAVEDAAALGVAIARTLVGSTVEAEVLRGREHIRVSVRVGQRPL